MKLSIRIMSGLRAGQVAELYSPGGSLGRGEENLICLPDPSVSSHHAYLTSDGRDWWVRDLKSTNKTRLDGVELNGSAVQLRPSGRLQFGLVLVEYSIVPEQTRTPLLSELPTMIKEPAEPSGLAAAGVPAPASHEPDGGVPATIFSPAAMPTPPAYCIGGDAAGPEPPPAGRGGPKIEEPSVGAMLRLAHLERDNTRLQEENDSLRRERDALRAECSRLRRELAAGQPLGQR